ncbi:MAG: DNA-3-methyladenine glycosylase 2 family protein [Candidatus Methanomethylophilaceae archaeon]|nr:DNA-3-methyladenine glycosylase 2 family protein [Thermoplasmata archaeon]MBQ3685166.1 DNA-3-methyladenine glycosylase 2 family protein [Candidatus Methanomethylophilaceae archaeon]
MIIDLDVSLDPTLGCGQAHRWRKTGEWWEGVLGSEIVRMRHAEGGIEVEGTDRASYVRRYLGGDDDLDGIISEISAADPYVASLASRCPGLRILRQEPWECLATYVLATNANVARIGKMVESVCDHFGTDLGGRHAFPEPRQILDGKECIGECRLGYREARFIELAQRVEDGEIDPEGMRSLDYRGCVEALMGINGVGPKVADCVAIFGYGHLNAFPVDARIKRVMEERYGVTGSYSAVSEYGMRRFGRYAGYAQEFLYHADFIERFAGPS